jgi:hypothetical protein
MIDFYLKAENETAMNKVLLDSGLVVLNYEDELVPAQGISIDTIGSFSRFDENDVETKYPEWHVNLRSLIELSEEQEQALTSISVTPSKPIRVWA